MGLDNRCLLHQLGRLISVHLSSNPQESKNSYGEQARSAANSPLLIEAVLVLPVNEYGKGRALTAASACEPLYPKQQD